MASKTITVKEKVYSRLKNDKMEKESFSDYFDRFLNSKKPDYFRIVGLWDKKTGEDVRKIIYKSRKEDARLSKERDKRLGLH